MTEEAAATLKERESNHTSPRSGTGGGGGGGLFGVALDEVMARPTERRIPTALKKLFLFLNGDAIEVEGLLRVPADAAEVALIRRACDTGADVSKLLVADAGETRVHAAGGAVKEYLRMLPEPLLTWELYTAFVNAAALSDATASTSSSSQRRDVVAHLLERLPPHNRALAQVLFLYLARVADHSHRNQMNSTNLALVLGPLLLRPPLDTVESMLHGPRVTSIIKYIIDSYDLLFSSPREPAAGLQGNGASAAVVTDGSGVSNPCLVQQQHPPPESSPRPALPEVAMTTTTTTSVPSLSTGGGGGGGGGDGLDRLQEIVATIDESIALVQSKLLALHKQLEATDSMEEAIQIAKKIRTAKRILFHDDNHHRRRHQEQQEQQEPPSSTLQQQQQQQQQKRTEADENRGAFELASPGGGGGGAPASQKPSPRAVTGQQSTTDRGVSSGGVGSCALALESGYDSQQGIRKTMEDAHVLIDDLISLFPHLASVAGLSTPLAFYAVYDGHSGTEAALEAAEVVHTEVVKQAGFVEGRIEEALQEGFQQADALILEKSARDGWKNGTTAVTAFVLSHTVYVANAGDSEAIMGQKQPDGSYKAVVLSHKHKPTDKDEKERIRAAGGYIAFGRLFGDLAVSRSLGDPDYKKPISEANYISSEPHVLAQELQNTTDECLILGCDGVWDVVNYQEALDLVAGVRKSGQSASGAAQALVKRALEKGSKDNVTAIVVYFTWN